MQQLHLWLKFYPKDWNGDHNLRACSLSARGLMASFLEPMHEANPYGHLLVRGKKPEYDELAVIASCKSREVKYGIEELVKMGVLSTTEDGILFSRRMVRDKERSKRRSENGKTGGNPMLILTAPTQLAQRVTPTVVNHEVNQVDKPIDTRSQKPYTRSKTSPAENVQGGTREFLNWFQGEYKARRNSATYFIRWGAHGKIVKDLLTTFPADRLKKHAQILLSDKTDDEWIVSTDRGIEVLSSKINWLEERLCAWETARRAREAV